MGTQFEQAGSHGGVIAEHPAVRGVFVQESGLVKNDCEQMRLPGLQGGQRFQGVRPARGFAGKENDHSFAAHTVRADFAEQLGVRRYTVAGDDGELIENALKMAVTTAGEAAQGVLSVTGNPGANALGASRAGQRGGDAHGVFESRCLAQPDIRLGSLVEDDMQAGRGQRFVLADHQFIEACRGGPMYVAWIVAPPVFAQAGKLGGTSALREQVAAPVNLAGRAVQRQGEDGKNVRVNRQVLNALGPAESGFGQPEREAGSQADRAKLVITALFAQHRDDELFLFLPRQISQHAEGFCLVALARVGEADEGQVIDQFDHEAG